MKGYGSFLGFGSGMAILVGLLHPSMVHAQAVVPLPAAYYSASATAGGSTSFPDVLIYGTTTYGGNAFVTNQAEITVSLNAGASGGSTGIVNSGRGSGYGPGAVSDAIAEVYWELEAINPSTGQPVTLTTPVYAPMNISGVIQTDVKTLVGSADSIGSLATANGQISWTYTNSQGAQQGLAYGNDVLQNGLPGTTYGTPGFLPLDQNFMAQANVENILEVQASGSSQGYGYYNSTSFSASVDPIIAIDPAWLAQNPGYEVVYSAGVAPSTVPLPASVWLLVSGVGALRALGARRQVAR